MVYKYFSNKNLFKIHKYAFPKASNIEFLRPVSPHHEGASCIAKLSIHYHQENVLP